MRILSIDTTSTFGSLALLDDDILVEEVLLHSPDGFGQVLFGHIGRLLERHGWTPASIGCYAAAAGPGSFTGVRIGLTAAKGLAEATGGYAVAVSNLEALAAFGTSPVRAVVMDARRGEVYGAVYDAHGLQLQPETVSSFRTWIDSLPPDVSEVISTDFSPFRASFPLGIPVIEQRGLAASVGRIAATRRGRPEDALEVDANYVRRSDAELNWTDAPVSR